MISQYFRDALYGVDHSRAPIWYMRQAGRYMDRYRQVRQLHSMEEICHTPRLAVDLTWEAHNYLGTDTAIIFSDIAIPLESLGYEITYVEGKGPVPVKDHRMIGSKDSMSAQSIGLFCSEHPETPVIGFVGGPVTLASYVVGHGPDVKLSQSKKLLWKEDEDFMNLLNDITDHLINEIREQIRAGAIAIQIFDSWIGQLDPESVEYIISHFVRKLTSTVRAENSKSIYFSTETSGMLEELTKTGADFLSLDWRVAIDQVYPSFPNMGFQGNLDPLLMESNPERALERSRGIMKRMRDCNRYIFNLGHGVLPGTDERALRLITEKLKGEL